MLFFFPQDFFLLFFFPFEIAEKIATGRLVKDATKDCPSFNQIMFEKIVNIKARERTRLLFKRFHSFRGKRETSNKRKQHR